MNLKISETEYDSLWYEQNPPSHNYNLLPDEDEILEEYPTSLGQQGYIRCMEIFPGVWLDIFDWKCDFVNTGVGSRDLILTVPVHEHEIQLLILTSGCFPHDEAYPTFDNKHNYLSGSGISPAYQVKFMQGQHFTGINIEIEPKVFNTLFPALNHNSAFAKLFLRKDKWKESFFPEVTPLMRGIVRQIINPPYRGIARKLYLQAKVLELLAMQLDPIMAQFGASPTKLRLKPQTIDRIYQARDILTTRLDNSPSILELAQQVGICDRTLRNGFRELFGTTVIQYITQLRLEQAERLLRERKLSVAEVANLVGYSHLGYFAKVFKRQFGITPSECLSGKKIFK
jgi:AraC-like DNA-binding protein